MNRFAIKNKLTECHESKLFSVHFVRTDSMIGTLGHHLEEHCEENSIQFLFSRFLSVSHKVFEVLCKPQEVFQIMDESQRF